MNIITKVEKLVKLEMEKDTSGHDWYHVDRVRKMALLLSEKEGNGYSRSIELAALLHDISDEKLNNSKEDGQQKLANILACISIDNHEKEQIITIISSVGFKGGNGIFPESLDAKIVQDADRLDAIGALGIARTFAYGGSVGSPIYDPSLSIRQKMTEEEYRKNNSSSIHHFYEKLLKIKNLLHTDSARKIAEARHLFMESFLQEFYKEWNVQDEKYFN
ncbi:HD domain-containing protein [Cytobacillus oceanisediminis]|uniref:HD domain-containing protein n=1 Tax=Cytobacillus oceanisediminis TaxID=665099 RepID=UPI001CCBF539|nr:HD domain-containing protein [Cytobacillus oceanisediminis]MBZ9534210.1 HD domain-containing protein [Cytobacillus oceanisediminis]